MDENGKAMGSSRKGLTTCPFLARTEHGFDYGITDSQAELSSDHRGFVSDPHLRPQFRTA